MIESKIKKARRHCQLFKVSTLSNIWKTDDRLDRINVRLSSLDLLLHLSDRIAVGFLLAYVPKLSPIENV
ncbi:hypothetical protein LEP1GSC036_2092 [Leptospira weilii str. 2006001853]|uniref:Uncharacterized protein n=3 Tax=Leptospira weilii TaxID=28184 RepID=A0A828Z4X4_9LEPT|nr:hypothetical protein [Leptospira weilii]EMM73987.1 hypothetical protein LEP1GSC038_2158 [Leptospira weilii str. 2006001855]EMN42658.1 hypothetical protein LEP1GSC086_1584 [Leptospira weilii str. LNT 1234]EMN89016.1 hypothetical protein LEP1GSC108_3739 [Leptospira weilii str. UI 13098]OMI18964.1 hypothetical protein BUQ74_01890 [Leptospira weilii serovar Heyan]EKR64950.1 hypothetical protein LEP1GSC036_2092 [Leptospira weilii str. 2006001853]